MGIGCLEPTFETLVESFVFLDKNKDGYVSKNEMIQAINETSAGERSSGRIGVKRFGELSSQWHHHLTTTSPSTLLVSKCFFHYNHPWRASTLLIHFSCHAIA